MNKLILNNASRNGKPSCFESEVINDSVGEPWRLRQTALRIPYEWLSLKSRAATLSGMCQLTYPIPNSVFFYKLQALANLTWQSLRTISDHLRRFESDGLIENRGRQKQRRTVSYYISAPVRASFDGVGGFLQMPSVALMLPTWNSRLLFSWLAYRWMYPSNNPDLFGDHATASEIAGANANYEFAKFKNIAELAATLQIDRHCARRGIEVINSSGLARITSNNEFTLDVPMPLNQV